MGTRGPYTRFARRLLQRVRGYPRLRLEFATDAPVVAVFRRGPTRWTRMYLWNTETDAVEAGGWIRAKIHSASISPDGKLICSEVFRTGQAVRPGGVIPLSMRYRGEQWFDELLSNQAFQAQHFGVGEGNWEPKRVRGYIECIVKNREWMRKYQPERDGPDGEWMVKGGLCDPTVDYQFTMVSRPPWFGALSVWPVGTLWHGGGRFTGNRRLVMCVPEDPPLHHPDTPPLGLEVVSEGWGVGHYYTQLLTILIACRGGEGYGASPAKLVTRELAGQRAAPSLRTRSSATLERQRQDVFREGDIYSAVMAEAEACARKSLWPWKAEDPMVELQFSREGLLLIEVPRAAFDYPRTVLLVYQARDPSVVTVNGDGRVVPPSGPITEEEFGFVGAYDNVDCGSFDNAGRPVMARHGRLYRGVVVDGKMEWKEVFDTRHATPGYVEAPAWASEWPDGGSSGESPETE